MANLTLVIGTRRYSSWSLRPWLALKQAGMSFDEQLIDLRAPDRKEQISRISPSGKVPLLQAGPLLIWDSLAICEYVAELSCARPLWPENRGIRAVARAISAEMHAGFPALRQELPMDVPLRVEDFTPSEAAAADIARIQAIWSDCRERFSAGGPYLFGPFSVADAMYAPVVFRFQSYGIKLTKSCADYCEAMLDLPAMRAWAEVC